MTASVQQNKSKHTAKKCTLFNIDWTRQYANFRHTILKRVDWQELKLPRIAPECVGVKPLATVALV